MNKPVNRIGRSLGQSSIASMIDGSNQARTFTLKSGKTVTFVRKLIPFQDIESSTFVDPQINGRDQSTLTEESVKEITRTIKLQQFFPAIGRLRAGRIEIMDGSRRRAACLLTGTSLEVLVTSDEIDVTDARQLAADIQTAKEHNLRELGLRFMLMHEKGMSKSDIARSEGISNAKVTRAFKAASVPAELIELFPVVSELTLQDYEILLDVWDHANAEGVAVKALAEDIGAELAELQLAATLSADEYKLQVLKRVRAAKQQIKTPVQRSRAVTEHLARFSDRNAYARRKENADKRTVHYEFSRLPKELADKIDESIRAILNPPA